MLNMKYIKDLKSCVRLSDGSIALNDEVSVEKEWIGDLLHPKVINKSGRVVKVKEIVLFSGDMPVDKNTEFYGEGYQMLCQYAGTLSKPEAIGSYGTDSGFFKIPRTVFDADLWTVYNLMLLLPENSDSILMAFTSCFRYSGEFRFKGSYIEVVMDAENLELAPGQSWEMEEFMIVTGADKNQLFADLAARIEVNHPHRRYPEIPTGWCSYYCMRPMTALGLFENAYSMAQRIPELKRIQIDGGYEAHNGDWLLPNPTLGADLKTICDGIRTMGAEPAGYISPFIVGTDSILFKEHQDWLVKDEEGKPFNEIGHKSDWYMLDGTHPEVQDYFRRIARNMHDEWGIRYFKLDFLSYGALPGGYRYDKTATRVEAFRRGMEAIVEEVGNDSFILGCNAPFWPILGLVHGNRVTNDIFRDWKRVSGNARELFWRNWQNNTLWMNDPDCILLEELDLFAIKDGQAVIKRCSLIEDEFEFHKAFIVASGGMILSGDLLPRLSDKNINVLRKLIPCTGVAARFDDITFTVGRVKLSDTELLCLFNWDDKSQSMEVKLDGKYKIYDFWTDEELGAYDGLINIDLAPHGGKVLKCKQFI